MRLILPVLLIFGAFAGLITMAVLHGAIPELQVAQALAGKIEHKNRKVKIHGIVDSISHRTRPLSFVMRDKANPEQKLTVTIDATQPDVFAIGRDVAVIVVVDAAAGTARGDKIFTKCPSKYEAAEERGEGAPTPAEYLKKEVVMPKTADESPKK